MSKTTKIIIGERIGFSSIKNNHDSFRVGKDVPSKIDAEGAFGSD